MKELILAKIIRGLVGLAHLILRVFLSEDFLLEYKPIHLCWWFRKHNLEVPKYFIAGTTTPTVTTSAATSIGATTATGNGEVTSNGGAALSARGFTFSVTSVNNNPEIGGTGVTNIVEGDTAVSTFSATLQTLTAGTGYSYKAYATNSKGTSYGSVQTFTSAAAVPTVTTSATFDDITTTSATANGNLTATGGAAVTRRGFCYVAGTSGDPTTANSVVYDDSAGFSTGTYSKALSSLTAEGSYRVRAYAVNSAGTGYGTTVQLTLTDAPPTVALGTNVVDSATITDTTPSFEFTGTDAGGDDVRYNIQIDTANTFDSGTTYTTIDSYPESNYFNYYMMWNGVRAVGQSFTGNGETLNKCSFYAKKTTTPTGTIVAKLYAHSGTYGISSVPTGEALSTSTSVSANSLTTSYALVDFTFPSPYTLTNGTYYVIVFEWSDAVDSSAGDPDIFIGGDNSTPTHGGNLSTLNSTPAWVAVSGWDTIFYLYTSTSSPLISHTSDVETAAFVRTADSDPFTSGQQVTYTVPGDDALPTGDTYYWRVRGLDPSGSNTYGAWSSTRSFTLSSGGGGTNMQLNVGDTWKDVTAVKLNVGDSWKPVTKVQINVGDTWKSVF